MSRDSRVFVLSQRNYSHHASRCAFYEFEDVISTLDAVDLFSPQFAATQSTSLTYKFLNRATRYTTACKPFYALLQQHKLNQTYDLFFACIQSPLDILSLQTIKNWRENCRVAVCWLDEIWLKEIAKYKHHLDLLKDFDYIFMNFSASIEPVAAITQRPCHLIHFAVDAIKFCPYPQPADRGIDVYGIGRRSPTTHQALLHQMGQKNFFYVYETLKSLNCLNNQEHRQLYAEILRRSRYFIANKAKFDSTLANQQEEVSSRFFEGIAAGAILIGMPPVCEAFTANFDWQDAVIPVSPDDPQVAEIIAALDANLQRLELAQSTNITNALLRHDWVYRWEQILQTIGMAPTAQMAQRKAHLQDLSKMCQPLNQMTETVR